MLQPLPIDRQGANRGARLAPRERELYEWVLTSFASGARPTLTTLAEQAERLGLDPERATATLSDEDLVHADAQTGEIVVAYPFSGRPTNHRVRIDGGGDAFAMCAVDALGIPFMLGAQAEIRSRDPLSTTQIIVTVDPGGEARWSPAEAVVVWGAEAGRGPSASLCCPVVNFFESRETATQYLHARPQLEATIATIPEALEVGRRIFGDVLAEPEEAR